MLLVFLAMAFMTLQDAIIKWLSGHLPVIEILFIRSLIMLPLILAAATATGQLGRFGTRRYGAHLLRVVLNFLAFITFFGALRLMPLADTLAIVFSAPIFIVLFSAIFLKEKVGRWRWSAVAVGFVGVLVMIRPGTSMLDWPVILALMASVFYALWILTTRTMAEEESSLAMLFYASAFFVLAGGMAAPFVWVTPGGEDLLMLGVVAVIAMTGLLMLIKAYRLAQASILAPFDYTSMIWAVLLGWFVWNELPGPWIVAGTVLVVFAGLIIVHREARMPHHAMSLRGATDE
jgi:drug/metabolite transporter (DMT)-like permease